jgi:hypothetical protein
MKPRLSKAKANPFNPLNPMIKKACPEGFRGRRQFVLIYNLWTD